MVPCPRDLLDPQTWKLDLFFDALVGAVSDQLTCRQLGAAGLQAVSSFGTWSMARPRLPPGISHYHHGYQLVPSRTAFCFLDLLAFAVRLDQDACLGVDWCTSSAADFSLLHLEASGLAQDNLRLGPPTAALTRKFRYRLYWNGPHLPLTSIDSVPPLLPRETRNLRVSSWIQHTLPSKMAGLLNLHQSAL